MALRDGPAPGAPAPVRRRRQARGEHRIDRIVDAAEELVADAGVRALGMNALARHAGISPGSLYQYFPGRGAVLEELGRRLADRFRQVAEREPYAPSRPDYPAPGALLDRLLEAAVVVARERPALLPLLAAAEERATAEEGEPNALFEAFSRSLPGAGALHDEDAVRALATRVFCAGVGLAVRQPDPTALLLRTRQAVLGVLRAPGSP
ncbi:TetR/AcrR family transcriptional regulator [Streptomyces sp. NPDC098101]|uniref:TetR/AcrR family transcriptional regulator n=1 Tax=Streptomyces sp. NPDC098101 TaxID=3366096 RepID=UPI00382FF5DD